MPPFSPRSTCSWLQRGAPLRGTAPHERAYVLVECAKPWQKKVNKSSGFPSEVREVLEDLKAGDVSFSILGTPPGRGEVAVYRRRSGVTLVDRFPFDAERLRRALAGKPTGTPAEAEVLVCTHGSRDMCCARLGVPVAQALSRAGGRRIVECSHLGGHRFAPVVLAMPEWRFFGRVVPERAGEFLEGLEDGRPLPDFYRGAGYLPPAAQVVEAAVWEQSARRLERSRLRGWEVSGKRHTVTLEAFGDDGSQWYRAELEEYRYAGVASCADVPEGDEKDFTDYRLASLAPAVPESR